MTLPTTHYPLPTKSHNRIIFLDYCRIFAFVSVLIGHEFFGDILNLISNPNVHITIKSILSILLPVFEGGGAGVVVFFLVSGYIITKVIEVEKPFDFLLKRIFRIYPLYGAALILHFLLLKKANSAPSGFVLIQQLSLLGDFSNTPYSLNGVEWTLRIEIIFYLFMTVLAGLKLFSRYRRLLPYVLLAGIMSCQFIAPFPKTETLFKAYFSMYCPFLLLGSLFFTFENKEVKAHFLLAAIGLVFYQYFSQTAAFSKHWLGSHFAFFGALIFFSLWFFKGRLILNNIIILFSEMTYAVYLLHHWLFNYFCTWTGRFNIPGGAKKGLAVILLFLASYIMMKLIEKPGIRVGLLFLKKIKGNKTEKVSVLKAIFEL